VTATLALFFAVGGGAFAAANSYTNVGTNGEIQGCVQKAGRHFIEIIHWGSNCPRKTQSLVFDQAGPRGVTGPQGSTGPQGVSGAPGNPAAYPTVLPSGQTEAGAFSVRWPASAGQAEDIEVSFPLPLATAPTNVYCATACGLAGPAVDPVHCPGSVTAPTATPGVFCIYPGQSVDVDQVFVVAPAGNGGALGRYGGTIGVTSNAPTGNADTFFRGTWAVTAP